MSAWRRSRSGSRPSLVLAALAASVVAFGFQQTAVIPAIPTIEHELQASRTWSAWLLSGYLVAASVCTPVVGKLGDRFGRRRLLLGSLVVFLAGSVGAALSQGLVPLVIFRAVQGVGGAVFPLTLALARDVLPADRVGRGVSLLTGGFGLGTTLGFGLSGVLVLGAGWRWIFWSGAGVVALAVVAVLAAPGVREPRRQASLDLPGAALLGFGLALVLVALTEGAPRGWTSPFVLGVGLAGLLALVGWGVREQRAAEPLLDVRLLVRRPVLLTNLATVGLGYVLFGVYFLVPYLLSTGPVPTGPVAVGLLLLPAALAQMVTGPLADPLAARIGVRATLGLGLLVMAGSGAGLAADRGGVVPLVAWSALLGVGAGLGIATGSTLVTETAADTDTGVAVAMNSVLRRVGGGVGGQVSAALIAAGQLAPRFTAAFAVCAGVAAAGAVSTLGIGGSGANR